MSKKKIGLACSVLNIRQEAVDFSRGRGVVFSFLNLHECLSNCTIASGVG